MPVKVQGIILLQMPEREVIHVANTYDSKL